MKRKPLPAGIGLKRFIVTIPGTTFSASIVATGEHKAREKFWRLYKPPFLHAPLVIKEVNPHGRILTPAQKVAKDRAAFRKYYRSEEAGLKRKELEMWNKWMDEDLKRRGVTLNPRRKRRVKYRTLVRRHGKRAAKRMWVRYHPKRKHKGAKRLTHKRKR